MKKEQLTLNKSTAKSKKPLRKHIRFQAEASDTAIVDFTAKSGQLSQDMAALILNESMGGCCLLAICSKKLNEGDKLRVKVGPLSPLKAEVAWIKIIDENIIKFGLRYLE